MKLKEKELDCTECRRYGVCQFPYDEGIRLTRCMGYWPKDINKEIISYLNKIEEAHEKAAESDLKFGN